jgi:hypothetical protein
MSETTEHDPQPAPVVNEHRPIVDTVIVELAARKAFGIAKYGAPLQPFNGRDALQDAIDEAMDLLLYLVQLREERDVTRRGDRSGKDHGAVLLDEEYVQLRDLAARRRGATPAEPFQVVDLDRVASDGDRLYGAILPQPDES